MPSAPVALAQLVRRTSVDTTDLERWQGELRAFLDKRECPDGMRQRFQSTFGSMLEFSQWMTIDCPVD
jgi:hypothetical protein